MYYYVDNSASAVYSLYQSKKYTNLTVSFKYMANIYNFPFNERKFSQTYDVDLLFIMQIKIFFKNYSLFFLIRIETPPNILFRII